jgi:hypothetical protein
MPDLLKQSGNFVVLRISYPAAFAETAPDTIALELEITGEALTSMLSRYDHLQSWLQSLRTAESSSAILGRWLLKLDEFGLGGAALWSPTNRTAAMMNLLSRLGALAAPVVGEYQREAVRKRLQTGCTIPPRFGRALADLAALVLEPDKPLWLELTPGRGEPLAIFEWERLLAQYIPNAIVRMPYHSVDPLSPTEGVVVAACVSAGSHLRKPLHPANVSKLLNTLVKALPKYSELHVFADSAYYNALSGIFSSTTADEHERQLVLHVPPRSADPEQIPEPGSDMWQEWEHPWNRWITEATGDYAIDILHWVCPVSIHDHQALIEVVRHPGALASKTGNFIRFIPPAIMSGFLNNIGAWAGVLTNLSGPETRPGANWIADQIALMRPGPAVVHDLVSDPQFDDITQAYQFLSGHLPTPRQGTLVMYCHPARTGQAPGNLATPASDAFEQLSTMMRGVLALPGPSPAWLLATQRLAEQSVTEVVDSEVDPELKHAAQAGILEAIARLNEIVSRGL